MTQKATGAISLHMEPRLAAPPELAQAERGVLRKEFDMPSESSHPLGTPLKDIATYAERRTHAHGTLCARQSREPELLFILDSRWATDMGARTRDIAAAAHRHCFWLAWPHGTAELKTFAGAIIEALHIRMPASLFSPNEFGASEAVRPIALLAYESLFRDSLMEQLALAIAEELETPTPQSALLHSLIACMAARLVNRRVKGSHPSITGNSNPKLLLEHRVSTVLRHIAENLNADLSIHTLARIACLSRFHFAKEFKRLTGHSPHKYISAQRMRLATSLLQRNDLRLADVASACGFMTQASFNKFFMRIKGETPGQYRRAACAALLVERRAVKSVEGEESQSAS